jgi:hypothetical protein
VLKPWISQGSLEKAGIWRMRRPFEVLAVQGEDVDRRSGSRRFDGDFVRDIRLTV